MRPCVRELPRDWETEALRDLVPGTHPLLPQTEALKRARYG